MATDKGPTPDVVRDFRAAAGLTQAQAADLVYVRPLTWAQWEKPMGDRHHRTMPLGLFELFCIKVGNPRAQGARNA